MADLAADFIAWMDQLPPGWIYATIFAVAYLENVVPPIPGDMVIVFGGYLVGLGIVHLIPVVALAALGGTLGFMTMYAVGWQVGGAVFDARRLRWIPKRPAWRARAWLLRYGYFVVAANRFLSGLRSVIALSAGAAHMHPVPTAACAAFSALVYTALIAYLGSVMGERWPEIVRFIQLYGQWLLGTSITLLASYLVYRLWRGRREARRSGEDPKGGPAPPRRH